MIDMYAAVLCSYCERKRIIDLKDAVTTCPYCSKRCDTSSIRILFKGETASAVREKLNEVSGVTEKKKEKGPDRDPMSTLQYHYDHSKGMEKLTVLAEGLTRIKGTFTQSDVKCFEPDDAEKTIGMMLDNFLIIEVRHGTYRSV